MADVEKIREHHKGLNAAFNALRNFSRDVYRPKSAAANVLLEWHREIKLLIQYVPLGFTEAYYIDLIKKLQARIYGTIKEIMEALNQWQAQYETLVYTDIDELFRGVDTDEVLSREARESVNEARNTSVNVRYACAFEWEWVRDMVGKYQSALTSEQCNELKQIVE